MKSRCSMSGSMGSTEPATCSFPSRCHTAASRSTCPDSHPMRRCGWCCATAAMAWPARAAARAAALGYRNVFILAGGAKAWGEAGYTLYAGVNVPSKVFGELVEQQRHTPRVSAQDVVSMRAAKEDFVIVDGRPFAEYRKMNIPGGICCPNGELVLRIADIAPDPNTRIVVNCAGRTRSIIGAQTLIDFGVPNPGVRAGERDAGLVPGRARTRARRQPPLCRCGRQCRSRGAAVAGTRVRRGVRRALSLRRPRLMPGSATHRARPISSMSARRKSSKRAACRASSMLPAASSSRRPTNGSASKGRGSCCSTANRCARR